MLDCTDYRASRIDPQITHQRVRIAALEGELTRTRSKLDSAEQECEALRHRVAVQADEMDDLRRQNLALWLTVIGVAVVALLGATWRIG